MGKARSFANSSKDTIYQKETDDELYSASSQQNSYNLGSTQFSDQSGIGNFAQSGDDQRKANLRGALFTGNIGFNLQTAVLDVGTETIDLLEDATSSALSLVSTDRIVTLSAGSTADLTTITGAQRPGQRLYLYNVSSNTITIKNTVSATANTILTPDAEDFTFENNMVVELVYDITTTQWRFVGSSGGGSVSFPIRPPVTDVVATAGNIDLDLDQTSGHYFDIGPITGDIDIDILNPPSSGIAQAFRINITQDGVGGHTVTFNDTLLTIPTIATDANSITLLAGDIYNGTVYNIFTMTTSGSGGGQNQTPWLSDIDAATFDLTNLDRLILAQDSGIFNASGDTGFVSSVGGDLLANTPTGTGHFWKIQNITHMTLNVDNNNTVLDIVAPDNGTIPKLRLFALDPSPTMNTTIGTLDLIAQNDNSDNVIYGQIGVDIEDTSLGTEDGSTSIIARANGTLIPFLSANDSADGNITAWRDLKFDTGRNLFMNSNRIYSIDDGTDTFIDGDSSSFQFFIDDASVKATFGDSKLLLANDYYLQTQIVEHRDLTSDPSSPLDGSIWYNSTDEKLRGIEGGVTFDLSSGASGANTALSNLTATSINQDLLPNVAGTFNLGSDALRWGNCFFGRIVFPTNTSPIASDVNIVRNGDDMQYNVPTGSTFNWTFQSGSTQVELSSAELILTGVNLDMENNSITDANQIQITGSSGDTVIGFLSGTTGNFDIAGDEDNGKIRIFAKNNSSDSNQLVTVDGADESVHVGYGVAALLKFGLTGNVPTISRVTDDLDINSPSGEISLQVGASDVLTITSTDVDVPTGKFLDITDNVSSATAGASTLPSNPSGFMKVKVGGIERRVPFYNV